MNHHKLLVIGLDGAPFPLIQKWSQAGYLPNLAKLIAAGSFGVLRSTMPVHSPTAWASFMTGLNPGKHGVYDFVRREPGSYQLRLVRANQIEGATLWHLLSQEGRQVGVINVPMTYPAEPVNGFLISGLGTPSYVTYTHPPELSEKLNAAGYRVNKTVFYAPGKEEAWLDEIYAITATHAQQAVRLMGEAAWDFFMVVVRDSDEICHYFWRYMDESHPQHDPDAPPRFKNAIRDYYHFVDEWVGRLVAAAGRDTNIVVMSDHGAGPQYKDVFLNEWLWQRGWLKLKGDPAGVKSRLLPRLGLTRKNISDTLTRLHLHRLEVMIKKVLGDRIQVLPRDDRPELTTAVDWSQTQAYSFGYYGQIFINLKGREPEGIVADGPAYDELRAEIVRGLKELVDPADGRPVVSQIYLKEALYHGPHTAEAPDILAVMRDFTYITRKGYEFAQQRGVLFAEPYTHESGSHRLEGILVAAGPDIATNSYFPECGIADLTPTLLQLLDCPIPQMMDGQIPKGLLRDDFVSRCPARYIALDGSGRDTAPQIWNDEMEAEMTERLKHLGYLA